MSLTSSLQPRAVRDGTEIAPRPSAPPQAVRGWLAQRWGFVAVVLAPTLIAALYLFAIASNQYVSEAHILVKNGQSAYSPPSGLGQLFGMGPSGAQTDAFSLADYLTSHDAVAAADRKLDLRAMFQRPGADPVARLWGAHPAAETLLTYYHRQVHAATNPDSGVVTLRVRAFRPADAQALAETLLEAGEARVNAINARSMEDALKVSRAELASAESDLADAQSRMTAFRTGRGDIDPEKTSTSQLSLVGQLKLQIAQTKAQLADMSRFVAPDAPQRVALAARLRALEAQAGAEAGDLTGGGSGGMAPKLEDYEALQLRADFAAKRYAAAAAALANAREQALRQQLFVERVVEPNLPQKSTYPRRWVDLATIFVSLLLVYGIGWLIVAGFREHAS